MNTTNQHSVIQRIKGLPAKVGRERNPVRFLLAKVLVKTGACRHLGIQRDGYRLCFHPSAMSSTLWVGSDDRREDERVLERLLKQGDTFVDIGANIGSLSLKAASLVGPSGRVTAIEAHPRTFGFLEHNVAINPFRNITLHNCALGDKKGTLHFANQASDDQNCVVAEGFTGSIPIEVRTLDDIDLGEIDLLKIDVEGYEKFVLEGASRTLARTKAVYFECWDRHCERYEYRPEAVLGILLDAGFGLFLTENGKDDPVGREFECERCVNLLAIRKC